METEADYMNLTELTTIVKKEPQIINLEDFEEGNLCTWGKFQPIKFSSPESRRSPPPLASPADLLDCVLASDPDPHFSLSSRTGSTRLISFESESGDEICRETFSSSIIVSNNFKGRGHLEIKNVWKWNLKNPSKI